VINFASAVTGSLRAVAAFTGRRNGRHLGGVVQRIHRCEAQVQSLDDAQLRREAAALRYRAKCGEPLDDLLIETFALVREAAGRSLGMRHYDVQLLGGVAMHHGAIAEMQTGEGKTLTATLPMVLAALPGCGAHLATANEYLAARDAESMRPLYEMLGLSVGVIDGKISRPQRRQEYAADVTYGTARDFGFDFLRDRLLGRAAEEQTRDMLGRMLGVSAARLDDSVQRELNFLLVDEADSILIDEARTPLVISAAPGAEEKATRDEYCWAADYAEGFQEGHDYEYDSAGRVATLTAAGRRLARQLPKPASLNQTPMLELYDRLEMALVVARDYIRDRHYVVSDGEVVIVDEFTGRLGEGRKWAGGIHHAVEAKEGLRVSIETGSAARITVQDFARRYASLAGMTGTIKGSDREIKKVYGLRVMEIPTNRPPRRQRWPERVFATFEEKWNAIADEIVEVHATGRPVLVGTRSIDKSEELSHRLHQRGIEHEVLNANNLAREASIVAAAGQQGKVTVATNMAGRGTDIKLGKGVRELGGMHVICSELHEAGRIDRQLIGRCGRQGDPGTYRQFASLEDDVLSAGIGRAAVDRLRRRAAEGANLDHLMPVLRKAQARVERKHFRGRRHLLYFEHQRQDAQRALGQDPYLDAAE